MYSQQPLQWNLFFAILSMLLELLMNLGNYQNAVESLLHHLSNLLSHLHPRDRIDTSGDVELGASHCIESLERQAISIPIDLYVNYGICLAHLSKVTQAQVFLHLCSC